MVLTDKVGFHDIIIAMMNNKIAMVNKELHTRLFDQQQFPEQEEEAPKIYRRQYQLPPQVMLKSMIKKGLTNTHQPFLSRPKTALSNFKRTSDERPSLNRLRSTATPHSYKQMQNRRYDEQAEPTVEYDFNREQPKEFNKFEEILNKMKFQREQQASRKKIKLDKYGEKKFRYAWRRSNIPV